MLNDCNKCKRLVLTEEEQQVKGTRFDHVCGKYYCIVRHLGRHPKITPCPQCIELGGYEPWQK